MLICAWTPTRSFIRRRSRTRSGRSETDACRRRPEPFLQPTAAATSSARLIDMRYCYAFLGERAAYSVFGSVLCVCGSLALYRGVTVRKYLDDFLSQRFLGRPCTYGDDRRLTYYCLREGRVLLAPDAVAWDPRPIYHAALPSPAAPLVEELPPRVPMDGQHNPAFAGSAGGSPSRFEIAAWSGFTTALIYTIAVRPAFTGHFRLPRLPNERPGTFVRPVRALH